MCNNKFDTMKTFKNILNAIDSEQLNKEGLVSILLLCVDNLEINTISETARKENKTPKGVRESKQYRKVKIGKQLFAIKGLLDNNLPF